MAAVRQLNIKVGKRIGIDQFPNFHVSGSISGMKKRFYGKDALLVRCGSYIYNVSKAPHIYFEMAKERS